MLGNVQLSPFSILWMLLYRQVAIWDYFFFFIEAILILHCFMGKNLKAPRITRIPPLHRD